jgi:predicted P-loop ATPase
MSENKPLIVVESGAVESASIATGYSIACRPANGFDPATFQGLKVILWPDATEESRTAFREFGAKINDIASEIKMIVPNGKPHGWNITAAVQRDKLTWPQIAEWAKASMMIFGRGEFPTAISLETNEAPDPITPDIQQIWDTCGLAQNKSGVIYNVDNIVRLLSHWPKFRDMVSYDEFYGRYFKANKSEWGDIDDINLSVLLQHEYGLPRLRTATVSEAIQCRGHQCRRNEPRDWMSHLRWDGKERIAKFFPDYFGTPQTLYHHAVGFNFWVGMVARVYKPGCQLDNMVILEGKQGIYKSKALEAIGGKWYMEASEELTSKDFFVALAGKLIIEIADLDSFSRADTTRIKKVITCRTDRYRAPYGRSSQDHPRQSVFVGTTNEQHYLRDNTGARRFWPMTCGSIDIDRIRSDRDQLFAEAVTQYIAGDPWYLMPSEATWEQQEDRREYDEWENVIQEYMVGKNEISLMDLASSMGFSKSDINKQDQRRIGAILRHFGWERKNVRRGFTMLKLWYPAQETQANQSPLVSPAESSPATV